MPHPYAKRHKIATLLAHGFSQREIARALNIPHSTLQKYLKDQQDESALPVPVHRSLPEVDWSLPATTDPDRLRADLLTMVQEWRERKAVPVHSSGPQSTVRHTYLVEPRWVRMVKEEAEAGNEEEKAVVHRIFQRYFE